MMDPNVWALNTNIVWNFQHRAIAWNTKIMDLHNSDVGIFSHESLVCENMKNSSLSHEGNKKGCLYHKIRWANLNKNKWNNLYIQSQKLIKVNKEALITSYTVKSHRYLRFVQLFWHITNLEFRKFHHFPPFDMFINKRE